MPVAPYHASLFHDRKTLYHFFSSCQQNAIAQNRSQIASISIDIGSVDPLVILQDLALPKQPHFYFENGLGGEAIAAIGSAVSLETEGKNRFSKTRDFIQSCTDQFVLASADPVSHTQPLLPRFFCSFSFFDRVSRSNSPFPATTVFLPQWQIARRQNHSYATANVVIHSQSKLETIVETLWNQFQTIQVSTYGVFNLPDNIRQTLNKWELSSVDRFSATVASALTAIRARSLNKVVLAHALDVTSRFPFQLMQSLHNLRQLHPDCCVFSTSNGNGQSFIGASPERLISICDRTLMTDALAGSAPRGRTATDDADLAQRLINSEKERREHQVVVDFLVDRLAHFGLTPQFAATPTLRQLSNIQHLHTPIRATLPAHLHPLDILAELHPTPAVAGMPRELACHLIHHYERFERSLYAAPLGWVDAQGNAEFIVGIRSAIIDGHHARLYAGAGIVAGSDPEKELAEIKLKFQALLRALV